MLRESLAELMFIKKKSLAELINLRCQCLRSMLATNLIFDSVVKEQLRKEMFDIFFLVSERFDNWYLIKAFKKRVYFERKVNTITNDEDCTLIVACKSDSHFINLTYTLIKYRKING